MNNFSVVVTGSSGGVGTAIKKIFYDNGYTVVGIDKKKDETFCHHMIECDISELATDPNGELRQYLDKAFSQILDSAPLKALINNAGFQIVKPLLELSVHDIHQSLATNMTSALVLSQILYSNLKESQGCIVNMGSIHSLQSKANFGAYSISKTALSGLTKAQALEWGSEVTVNSIDPAAIDTEMLRAGFNYDPVLLAKLSDCHPTKSIASVTEVAKLAYFLVHERIAFINGSSIAIDGGISRRLTDPE